jgi:tRNA-(ms[2]io[6]A)-hydroxylase
MRKRGIALNPKMQKDAYVDALQKHISTDKENGLLDRLIIGSIVENRGFERFKLIAENISDNELAKFYHLIYTSEEKHGDMFLQLARHYFTKEKIEKRYYQLAGEEAKILLALPIKAALH